MGGFGEVKRSGECEAGEWSGSPTLQQPQQSDSLIRKRLKYEGNGPWPLEKIMSCLFKGAGVRETLGRIRWMFLPVKQLSTLLASA
ncbi:hypothetical protein AVEN_29276-1 [Araneus ventricosus]|uniref:Uncharacterized protein n=1 Tax=Araneus ventricosus TaxID=182803 RepID=A0A4Y2THP6_ARAVE|nr:hypothetical protein AVEN_29276-1 [Araneus ventricosus]